LGARAIEPVLPFEMVPRVHADLEALVADLPREFARTPADVRSGKERPVEQRPDPVMADDRCSLHLLEEAGAEDPPDGPTGVVRPDAEQKRRAGIVAAQDVEQARHAFARAPERVDVDLEGEQHGTVNG